MSLKKFLLFPGRGCPLLSLSVFASVETRGVDDDLLALIDWRAVYGRATLFDENRFDRVSETGRTNLNRNQERAREGNRYFWWACLIIIRAFCFFILSRWRDFFPFSSSFFLLSSSSSPSLALFFFVLFPSLSLSLAQKYNKRIKKITRVHAYYAFIRGGN